MDGNGRWAKKRLLNRIKGHEKGAETVRTMVRTCREIGISVSDPVRIFHRKLAAARDAKSAALMALLKKFLATERPNCWTTISA